MARAKKYYIPGHVWHVTHRCHKKEFLLKFSRDQQRWLERLFEAKKRYGIRVLNYMVTLITNYIDLNMARAGVVKHPSEWKFSGFNEIQKPRRRYDIIDYKSLTDLLNFDNYDNLKRSHRGWVEELLEEKENVRDRKWTESISVGSKKFIEKVREKLGFRARGRKVNDAGDASFQLREAPSIYGDDSANIDICPGRL